MVRALPLVTLLALLYACRTTKDASDSDTQLVGMRDEDGDSYTVAEGDCDDGDAEVHPGATEDCDGVDDDCDGLADDGTVTTWYRDVDGDGYGDPLLSEAACEQPAGYVSAGTDCDDGSSVIHPGQAEECDHLDNNCDGTVDEGVSSVWYVDADSDGYGDPTNDAEDCEAPMGYVADNTDCNDHNARAWPENDEICDGVDNDCDGSVDEDLSTTYYYVDEDDDGFGNNDVGIYACSQPSDYVTLGDDCDDTDPFRYPTAVEADNGIDDNCDGIVDGTLDIDDDDDGYSETDGDCDDTDSAVNPDAVEVSNGIDDDCDTLADDGTDTGDDDGDGWTEATGDCNDADSTVHPEATETVDSRDEDCDGTVDEAPTPTTTTATATPRARATAMTPTRPRRPGRPKPPTA